jgi:ribosomal protein L37AE/L43A
VEYCVPMRETEAFWERMEQQELEQAREEFLAGPCPECDEETLQGREVIGWECPKCGTSDLPAMNRPCSQPVVTEAGSLGVES